MRNSILTILFWFVTRGLVVSPFLFSGGAHGGEGNPTLDLPSMESLAAELGHAPRDFRKSVDDFAMALSQGSKSQALKRLCVKDEQSCALVKDFQEQSADAKRDRLKARKKGKPFRVTDSNVAQVQRFDFRMLISSLKIENDYGLFSLAEKSLKESSCPRNLSAALSVRAEEFFPFEKARGLSRELFMHARPCLDPETEAFERLYLRQALYVYADGKWEQSREFLLEAKKSKVPTERYRVLFWLGKIANERDKDAKENENWLALLNEFPLSFYSIEAAVSLKKDPIEMIMHKTVLGLKREVMEDPELNRMIRWLEALYLAKKPSAVAKWASWIVRANEEVLTVEVLHYLSTLKIAAGMYRSNITMLFGYFRKNPQALNQESLRLMYPRPYLSMIQTASEGKIDSFLVMGLMRQESAFDPRAVSRAKAKGLMQIIPQTARRLASQGHRKLMDEKENTKMGIKYLLQLGDRFSGRAELVLAAYNAGPHRVEEWLKRNPNQDMNPLLWNDLIPYMETRDYVVSILRNNYLYERLYGASTENSKELFRSTMVKALLAQSFKK